VVGSYLASADEQDANDETEVGSAVPAAQPAEPVAAADAQAKPKHMRLVRLHQQTPREEHRASSLIPCIYVGIPTSRVVQRAVFEDDQALRLQ
jgi:hypothetical protein